MTIYFSDCWKIREAQDVHDLVLPLLDEPHPGDGLVDVPDPVVAGVADVQVPPCQKGDARGAEAAPAATMATRRYTLLRTAMYWKVALPPARTLASVKKQSMTQAPKGCCWWSSGTSIPVISAMQARASLGVGGACTTPCVEKSISAL